MTNALEALFAFAAGNRRTIEAARSFDHNTITLACTARQRPAITQTSQSFEEAATAILDRYEPDWRERRSYQPTQRGDRP